MAGILSNCFDLVAIQMDQKNLIKILEIDPLLSKIDIESDEQRLKQIFVNLISNSLKFTFSGYIKIKAGFISNGYSHSRNITSD